MRVLVTGATGFVGTNLVNHLKNKHEVIAFVRNKEKASKLDVEIRVGDILNKQSIIGAINDIDAIIHVSGEINAIDLSKLYAVNRFGCRNVSIVAKKKRISNIIYISSLAARGPDGKPNPISHYGYSKRLGELELLKLHYDSNLKILRPPIIYGPYDKGLFDLFKMAKLGILPKMNKVYSLVFIDDLVEAISKLIDLYIKKPEVFYISSSIAHFKRINRAMFDAFGKKGFEFYMPDIVPQMLSFVRFGVSPFSPDKVREIKPKAWTCDNEVLFKYTGFKPKIEIEEGFKITAKWYIENGWL